MPYKETWEGWWHKHPVRAVGCLQRTTASTDNRVDKPRLLTLWLLSSLVVAGENSQLFFIFPRDLSRPSDVEEVMLFLLQRPVTNLFPPYYSDVWLVEDHPLSSPSTDVSKQR